MLGTGTHFFPRNYRQSLLQKNIMNQTTTILNSAQIPFNKQKNNSIDTHFNSFQKYKKKQLNKILKSCQDKVTHQPKILTVSQGKKKKKYLCVKGFQKQPSIQKQHTRKLKKDTEISVCTHRNLYKHSGSFCWNHKICEKPRTVEVRLRKRQSKQTSVFKGWDTVDEDIDFFH